jgi:hypothetical protein
VLEQRLFLLKKNCKVFIAQKDFHSLFRFIDDYAMGEVSNLGLEKCKKKYSMKKNQ